MKTLIFCTILIVQSCFSNTSKQESKTSCKPCDIEQLVGVYQSEIMNEEKLDLLFCLGENGCSENIEFSQLLNETVFKSLQINPELFCSKFEKISNNKYLVDQLKNPISDEIDIESIITKIEGLKNKGNSDILEALKTAKAKI